MNRYKHVLAIALTGLALIGKGQDVIYPYPKDSSIIQMKSYYRGFGKVFYKEEDVKKDFFGNAYPKPFSPTYQADFELGENDIVKAEKLLLNKYFSARIDGHTKNDFNKAKKQLKSYYRQYFGYISKNNEIIIYIKLLNFRKKKSANKYFSKWDQVFFSGFGRYYEQNAESYIINLTTENVSLL